MKKVFLAIFIALLAAGGGVWWFLRGTGAQASLEETSTGFGADNLGVGRILRFSDGGTPLRIFQWLLPSASGIEVAQVLTQTDRQQIAIYQNGQFLAQLHLPRPEGVTEAFYRFAQLRDAAVIPGDVAVLLYRAQNATAVDIPLILALDLKTQSVRWSHRAAVERLAMAIDPKKPEDSAVIAYGDNGDLVRIPLALQAGEREGAKPPRAAAQAIEMPPEIQGITDLLPTGPSTFLISHRNGISAYLDAKGWNHISVPTPGPLGFVEPKSSLAFSGKQIWWQPEPGQLIQVKFDGTPVAMWNAKAFPLSAPNEKDAELLQLLGADTEGRLWFGLAAPTLLGPLIPSSQNAASIATPVGSILLNSKPKDGEWKADAPATAEPVQALPSEALDRGAWENYLHQGLDRLYCWDPGSGSLKRASWTASWRKLGPPSDFTIPLGDGALRPAAGGFLFGYGTLAWWLPLKELPLATAGTSGNSSAPPALAAFVVKAPPSPMMDLSGLPGTPNH